MSRETDSSFPKGSEPDDEPQTETTLTTRIRINIPGSRPIPPVVVRTPVDPSKAPDAADRPGVDQARSGAGQPSGPSDPPESAPADDPSATSSWFAPRKPPSSGAPVGEPERTATPPDGTPLIPPRTDTPPDGTPGFGHPGPYEEPSAFDGMSAFDGGPPHPAPPSGSPAGSAPTGPTPPAGHTTGPASGDMPLLPPQFQQPADAEPPPAGGPTPPSGITGVMKPPVPTGELPRDEPGQGAGGGIPVVPSSPQREREAANDPFAGFAGTPDGPASPEPGPSAEDTGGEEPEPFTFSDPVPRKRKGRSVLVLLGVAGAGVLGIAYGAGLLLNHADVPNGTAVLGVDIGGSTQEEAVAKLDAALGDRTTAPLKITVDGKERSLKPSVAGLGLDTEATVRGVTGRDYNPVSVIGSLLGGSRDVQPTYKVDEDKLAAAVEGLSGGSGNSSEAMVRFENGKAVPVPGKAAMAVDTAKAASAVEQAYKERAASGKDVATTLPVSKQQPKITEREMRRAIKKFGDPAMSGWVWLRAGGVEVPFSEKSISDFFTLRVGGSTLQPHVDPKVLAEKYGSAFDAVVIDAGTGTVKMTPKHAAAAVSKALIQPAPSNDDKRVAEVQNARIGG